MDDVRKRSLSRLAFDRGVVAGAKVAALRELWTEFDIPPDSEVMRRIVDELQRVARGSAATHRDAVAVQQALDLLADIERGGPPELQRPSGTPDELAGVDYWPFCCHPAHHGMEPWRGL